jgi:myo-inositol catabolism protein IolH
VKVALDTYMLRNRSLPEVTRIAADIGYKYLEPMMRPDLTPLYLAPRANKGVVAEFKQALRETGVQVATLPAIYKWSWPDEPEREAAVRYWKKAIQLAVEMEVPVMNTEFSGRPERAEASEAAFWKSMEELLPLFEKEGITLHIEPHPDDWVEANNAAVDTIRAIGSPNMRYLYCAPHTFHLGGDVEAMIRYAAPVLGHVHVADTFDHRQPERYIVQPAGTPFRVHQHLKIGQGELDWDIFFKTLRDIGFDGTMTAAVYGWNAQAIPIARYMLEQITHYLAKYPAQTKDKTAVTNDPALVKQ